jgi:hypothetical protein
MSSDTPQLLNTMGVFVNVTAIGHIELFQSYADEPSSTIVISEDEARLLVLRIGRHLGMKVSHLEDADDED